MGITVSRFVSRKALSPADAAFLTLVAVSVALLASILVVAAISYFVDGVLPANLFDMTFDGFLQYAAGYSILSWVFITLFDLTTDVKFARDYDIGEIVFGAFLGPVASIAMVKLGWVSAATLVGNLWLWPVFAFVYYLMKRTIGR